MYDRILLTIDEVVYSTSISKSELYRLMKAGKLRWHRVAGRRRVEPKDLDDFLNLSGTRKAA